MVRTLTVDPVTRVEGHLRIEIDVEEVGGQTIVVNARSGGTLFRGFEAILQGRNAMDAPLITARICGVCPVSHAVAATQAVEAAAGFTPPPNARRIRNLILAANFLQSHILHFYHLALLDFVDGPAMPPWIPAWNADKRVSGESATRLIQHYQQALDARRAAHSLGAIFAGHLPHPATILPGGVTAIPSAENLRKSAALLTQVASFIRDIYQPDVDFVADIYGDYFAIGVGHGHVISSGVFAEDDSGEERLFSAGFRELNEAVQLLNMDSLGEDTTHSWYKNGGARHPASGATIAEYPKQGAYSWLKAPRYNRLAVECGPLARQLIAGNYQGGISVMDRHRARAQESWMIVRAMERWLGEIDSAAPFFESFAWSSTGEGFAFVEAPRGALGHWLRLNGETIEHYQIITPTCFNASPQDSRGVRGPLEQALLGLSINNPAEPIEALRVVHSFDPCLACAVHVAHPESSQTIRTIS